MSPHPALEAVALLVLEVGALRAENEALRKQLATPRPEVRTCAAEDCQRPFCTTRAAKRFCSELCQNRIKQREKRKRQKPPKESYCAGTFSVAEWQSPSKAAAAGNIPRPHPSPGSGIAGAPGTRRRGPPSP